MERRNKAIGGGAMLLLVLGLGVFACDGEHGDDEVQNVNEGGASAGADATTPKHTPSIGSLPSGTPEPGVYHLTSVLYDDELCKPTAPLYDALSVSVSSPTARALNRATRQPDFGDTLRSRVDFMIKDGNLGPTFDLCGQSIPWGDPVVVWVRPMKQRPRSSSWSASMYLAAAAGSFSSTTGSSGYHSAFSSLA